MLNSIEIQLLIDKMHLEEKIGMLHGDGIFQTKGVKRLGIPPLIMSDGPMGVRQEFPLNSWVPKGHNNDYVTYFPSNTALAATWNRELAYSFGQALGSESRNRGKDIILAPGINIIRSPFCGRNFEYLSEDPYLTSEMAVPIIKGIQENHVAACLKHYIANNQETNRLEVDIKIDHRTLEEIYLPAFEKALMEGHSLTVMSAYNKFNGSYCSENTYLLKDILRDRFAYDGLVISDWGACHSTVASANAGLDIEMAVALDFDNYFFADPLYAAVQAGHVDMKIIDDKVRRILLLMNRLHMLDSQDRLSGERNTIKHQQGTLNVAAESIVLLDNKNNTLPLNPKDFKSIAIIGENADMKHSTGGGSAEIKSLYEHTPYAGIESYLGGNYKITFVKGYTSAKDASEDNLYNLRLEARRIASCHDLIIFVGGLNHDYDTEGHDRSTYTLPYQQDILMKELYEVNTNIVSVCITGSAVDLSTVSKYSKALIHTSYNGMEGGKALAHILFGQCSPSGKLPYTIANSISDYASHSIGDFGRDDQATYHDSIYVGYRHFDTHGLSPQYAFGHGLSYANFDYSNLILHSDNEKVTITYEITNTSDIVAKEVSQLYISQANPSQPRPSKELKNFNKIQLEPNETKTISASILIRDLGFYNEEHKQWITELDLYTIYIGASSKDIRLSEKLDLRKAD